MVFEWGKLPDKGYKEEISDDEELFKGDLVFYECKTRISERSLSMPKLPSEQQMAQKIIGKIGEKGQKCTYIRVTSESESQQFRDWTVVTVTFNIEYMVYIQHNPIPAVLIGVALIAGIIASIVGMFILAPVIWKWAGLSPEEIAKYVSQGVVPIVTGVGAVMLILLAILIVLFFIMGRWKR